MRLTLVLLLDAVLVGILAISLAGQPRNPQAPAAKALHELFDAEWDYSMREDPQRASELGDRRWIEACKPLSATTSTTWRF